MEKHCIYCTHIAVCMLKPSLNCKHFDEKRKNIKQILIDHNLPLPGTILYPPADKVKGNKLLRYEIDSEEILAVVECFPSGIEIYWTLEQVKQCTI